jgi:hypothetical protein
VFFWLSAVDVPDKMFIYLGWFALLSLHGLVRYFRHRIAFLYHLLLFAAGNAFIWRLYGPTEEKIVLNLGWIVPIAIIGVILYRNERRRRLGLVPVSAAKSTPVAKPAPPKRTPAPRRPAETTPPRSMPVVPPPVYEEDYAVPEAESELTYEPDPEYQEYYDDEREYYTDTYSPPADEPKLDPDDTSPTSPVKPKRKPRKRND